MVFDLDGTLLNTLQDLADAANYVCRENGWPEHTLDEYRYFVGNGIPKLCQRFVPQSARDEASQKEVLARFSARYAAHKEDTTAPYPGIEEMLDRLEISPKQRMKQMSKGTREKVQLILTMSRQAKLYLLDEPIAGVDPAARDYILDTIIRNYNPGGGDLHPPHRRHREGAG